MEEMIKSMNNEEETVAVNNTANTTNITNNDINEAMEAKVAEEATDAMTDTTMTMETTVTNVEIGYYVNIHGGITCFNNAERKEGMKEETKKYKMYCCKISRNIGEDEISLSDVMSGEIVEVFNLSNHKRLVVNNDERPSDAGNFALVGLSTANHLVLDMDWDVVNVIRSSDYKPRLIK